MANYAIWAREKGATKMYIWDSHHKSRRSAERKAKLLHAKFPSVKFKVAEYDPPVYLGRRSSVTIKRKNTWLALREEFGL